MEILFENKYIRDKAWAKDINKYLCYHRPVIYAIYAAFGVYFLFGVFNLLVNRKIEWAVFFLPIIWVIVSGVICRSNTKTVLKRDAERSDEPIEVTAVVTEETIQLTQSTGAELEIPLYEVKNAARTKTFVYIFTKTGVTCSFKKDGFTTGDWAGFVTFLKEKGIKVR